MGVGLLLLPALAWLLAANASCLSLATPNLAATFSEVMPMGSRHDWADGLVATLGLTPPCQSIGLADMVSTPPARPMV